MLQKTNLFVLAIAVAVVAGQAACPVYKGKECGGEQEVKVRGKEFTVKHGECRNGECDCELGFSGPDCGTHGCTKNLQNCSGIDHGTCIDEAYEFQNPDVLQSAKNAMTGIPRCQCKTGWTGSTCADRECSPACKHNGHCLNGVCHCSLGYAGTDCGLQACGETATKVTDQDTDPNFLKHIGQPLKGGCSNHGVCALPTPGGMHHNAYCKCNTGYEGPFCQNVKNAHLCEKDANGKECAGHGSCEATDDQKYFCQCEPAWRGDNCNIPICLNNCSSHLKDSKGRSQGSCSPRLRRCICSPGFTGANCSTPDCPGTIRDYDNGPTNYIMECSGHGSCSSGMCACKPGYAGADCKDFACKNNCNGRGKCDTNPITNMTKCLCNAGYNGTFCTEKSKDACSGNGVGFDDDCDVNDKLCKMTTPRPEKQRCDCGAGFKGKKCEHKICMQTSGVNAGLLCSGNGTCSSDYKSCTCDPGFIGPLCGRRCPIDLANGETCGGRGECVVDDASDAAVCRCINTFTGPTCSIPMCPTGVSKQGGKLEQCSGLVQGKCILDGNNSATCFCRDGYTGDNCAKLTCPADCSGHGRCDSQRGRCFCEHGFAGFDCATAACCDATCSGNGKCMEGSCQCKEEWYGMSCETKSPYVTHSFNCKKLHHCFQHGDCDEKNNMCICKTDPETGMPLWKGKFCQVPICKNDCSGNGECAYSATGDRGVCQCKPGWYGAACQKHGCPSPQGVECSGYGKCFNGTCYCHPGRSGEGCERKRCPSDCNGHGVCSSEGVCSCLDGYTGDGCQNKNCPGNGANGIQCSGHGLCHNGDCHCTGFHNPPFSTERRWTGSDCNTETCPSGKYEGNKIVPGACSGHGTCRKNNGTTHSECACAEGYTGAGCEIETCKGWGKKRADGTYPFQVAKCNNRGTCVTSDKKPRCQCNPGFAGDACEDQTCPEPGCHEEIGQGKCVKGKCFCNTNFTGRFCEQIACKKCDPLHKCINDCHNQGTCNNGVCSCHQGFTGEDCGILKQSFKHVSTLIHSVTGKPCVSSCNSQCAVKPHASKVDETSCNWACRHKCVPKPSAGLRSQ